MRVRAHVCTCICVCNVCACTCVYVLMRCVYCFGYAGAHLCVLTRAYACTCVCVCRVCVLGVVCVGMLCLGVCRRLHSSHCPAQQTVLVPEVHSQGQEESSSQTSCPGTHSGVGRPMASSGVWAGARVLRAQHWSVSRGQKLAFPFATTDQKSRAWQDLRKHPPGVYTSGETEAQGGHELRPNQSARERHSGDVDSRLRALQLLPLQPPLQGVPPPQAGHWLRRNKIDTSPALEEVGPGTFIEHRRVHRRDRPRDKFPVCIWPDSALEIVLETTCPVQVAALPLPSSQL